MRRTFFVYVFTCVCALHYANETAVLIGPFPSGLLHLLLHLYLLTYQLLQIIINTRTLTDHTYTLTHALPQLISVSTLAGLIPLAN